MYRALMHRLPDLLDLFIILLFLLLSLFLLLLSYFYFFFHLLKLSEGHELLLYLFLLADIALLEEWHKSLE